MTFKVEVCVEHFMANIASETFHSTMHFHMFVEVRSLSKAEPAICERADIWSLIRMDPQMIKKVVPLSKPFLTSYMVTLQYLDVSLGLRIFVGENSEQLSIRDVFFNLDTSQIECSAWLNSDHHLPTYFIEGFTYLAQWLSFYALIHTQIESVCDGGSLHICSLWMYTSRPGITYSPDILCFLLFLNEIMYLLIFLEAISAFPRRRRRLYLNLFFIFLLHHKIFLLNVKDISNFCHGNVIFLRFHLLLFRAWPRGGQDNIWTIHCESDLAIERWLGKLKCVWVGRAA